MYMYSLDNYSRMFYSVMCIFLYVNILVLYINILLLFLPESFYCTNDLIPRTNDLIPNSGASCVIHLSFKMHLKAFSAQFLTRYCLSFLAF